MAHAPQPWACKYLQKNDYIALHPNGNSNYSANQFERGSSLFCCRKFSSVWEAHIFSALEFTSYLKKFTFYQQVHYLFPLDITLQFGEA
jgi:hypothetical protein